MALHLVLLTAILAFSLASTDQCVSSPGSSIDLTLRSHKNASGDWIITVDTRRLTRKDNPREFSVNVQHETRKCGRYEIEEHVSMAFVYPSLHDTSMPGTIEPSTTTTAATPSTATISTSTSTTVTPSTTTTTTSTTTPKSCPHSGYQSFPDFSCYKAFPSRDDWKNWSDARDHCRRDGGDLMVIETKREKKDVYIALYKSINHYPWVGVHIPQGGDVWTTVKDTSMPGAIEPSTTTTTTAPSSATATSSTTATPSTTTTTATPFTTTTTATSSTTATPSTTTTTATPFTTTTTATSSTSTTTSSTTSPRSCPPGYELSRGYNCYKAFHIERKTWSEARQQCIRDGGDLMVTDREREREDVYLQLYNSVSWYYNDNPWVGVYIPPAGNYWTTVRGQPALSTWWWPGYPKKDAARKCARALDNGLLVNWDCTDTINFICETLNTIQREESTPHLP